MCIVCYVTDHSTEACPRLQYQDDFEQASMMRGFQANQPWNESYTYDLRWCPQSNSWWNNNQNLCQFSQGSYQAHQPPPAQRQSLDAQKYLQLTREYIQRMEESSKKFDETLRRMEYTQQILDTLCARDVVDASIQQDVVEYQALHLRKP